MKKVLKPAEYLRRGAYMEKAGRQNAPKRR
jgi:hypothetical protein